MHVLDGGETVVLGDPSAMSAAGGWADAPRTAMLGLLVAATPLMLMAWYEPASLRNPSAIVRFELFCLGCFMLLRFGYGLLVPKVPVVAVFNRTDGIVEVTSRGLIGVSREAYAFGDVEHIRLSRGEWDDASAIQTPVMVLGSKRAVALPASLSDREVGLLRSLTGIR